MGLAAAVIGSAVIGTGASIISANSTKNAAKDTAAQDNALEAQIYNSNKSTLQPFVDAGTAATRAQSDFLNGAPSVPTAPAAQGAPGAATSGAQLPASVTINGKSAQVGGAAPANPQPGQVWIDTSSGSPLLRVYDQSQQGWAGASTTAQQQQVLGGQTLQQVLSAATPSASGSTAQGQTASSVMINGRNAAIGSTAPTNPTSKQVWIDQSTNPPSVRVWDNSSRKWATAGTPAQQQQALGGQTLDQVLASASRTTVAGPTNTSLQNFEGSAGLSGPLGAIGQTLGASEADYLARTGQDQPTQQLSDLYGRSLADYEKNTGQGQTVDQIKGQLGGSLDQYLTNAGVKDYNDAIDKFLGVGAGGLGDYLNSTGYNFTLKQGLDAATQGAAAKGMLNSGSTLKALQDRGSQIANTYGQQYLTNLGTVAGQREGQNQDYLTGLGNLTGLQSGIATNYATGVNALAGLKGSQAGAYLAGQNGLYNDNQNAFATYWGAQNDVANRGAGAASSLAGVGQNYASSVSANNTNTLGAVSGANSSVSNNINGLLGNALGAWAYTKGGAPTSATATAATNPLTGTIWG